MTTLDLRVVISRLERSLRDSLQAAVARAVARGHASVEIEHWLADLTDGSGERDGSAIRALRAMDVEARRVSAEVLGRLDRIRGGHESAPSLSRTLLEWIEEAWLTTSLRFGRNHVAVADLLAALTTSAPLARLIRDIAPSLKLDESRALDMAAAVRPEADVASGPQAAKGGATGPSAGGEGDLARYTVDLTAQARAGHLDPVIGRESELRQVIDILMRRRQNNPILTGEAGVGKTAVVEALALRIADGQVPDRLAGVTVLALDIGLLQAGAGVKGEFERRLTGLIAAVKASAAPIILFIDEAHLMIGAGNQSGGSDAANLLKPALARGELRTIAATTWSEYKRHIERDPALTRRFQVVKVDEPRPAVAVRMLRAVVPSLERHHGVRIRDAALAEAVRLSARHLPDRQLPDKAIGVLDTACANVAIGRSAEPAAVEDLAAELTHLAAERDALAREEAAPGELSVLDGRAAAVTAELAALRARVERERELLDALDALAPQPATAGDAAPPDADEHRHALESELAALQGETPFLHRAVDRDAVAAVVARWTGVPVGRLLRDSVRGAVGLAERLRARVIGQDHALATIASAMRTAAAGLADPRKPPGVFLMVGTSGVGKTETALALADELYGGAQHLSIINMSEFKEEHKVSSLVGAPPGYVGYGEGGVLTEAVRRRPYGLLLMDEVEKAHPGVQDVFLQVFDKGVLRDGEGRDVEFLNTTILLTANAGAETLAALATDPETMPEGDALVEALRPELGKYFKPAFLGRVIIVPYLPLDDAMLRGIARLQLARLAGRLAVAHGAKLSHGPEVEAAITARCLAGAIGARAIEGVLSREILPKISDAILERALDGDAVDEIHVAASDGVFTVDASVRPPGGGRAAAVPPSTAEPAENGSDPRSRPAELADVP